MDDEFDNEVDPVPSILSCHIRDSATNASGDASKRANCKQFAFSITSLKHMSLNLTYGGMKFPVQHNQDYGNCAGLLNMRM